MKKIKMFPIICAVFALSMVLFCVKPSVKASSSNSSVVNKTVIVDAGHGGIDGGAVSKSGIVEKNINLSVAKLLESRLKEKGFKVIMTRNEDISIHDSDAKTIRQQKRSDLHNRLEMTEKNPDAIFVSIHQNTINDTVSHGAQIFYSPNNPESERLANFAKDAFMNELQPDNTREIKPAGKNLFLLYNTKIPAIMAECGFLSNEAEAKQLNSAEYQQKIAETLCSAIVGYYNSL